MSEPNRNRKVHGRNHKGILCNTGVQWPSCDLSSVFNMFSKKITCKSCIRIGKKKASARGYPFPYDPK